MQAFEPLALLRGLGALVEIRAAADGYTASVRATHP